VRTARNAGWDLTALVNAADPKAPLAERHLWLVRLMEWLRHAPAPAAAAGASAERPDAARPDATSDPPNPKTPPAALRLRHLLNQLDRHDALRAPKP
jgi:hypothetical protein